MKVINQNTTGTNNGYTDYWIRLHCLPTMALISSKNIKVHGVDINSEVVNNINNGKIHIKEPDVEELILKAHEQKLISASLRPKPADVHVIVVPTPFKNNFEPDISYVISAADSLKDIMKEGDLIIIESTSPVGTTEKVNFIYNERKDIKGKLNFAYCPEEFYLEMLCMNCQMIGLLEE